MSETIEEKGNPGAFVKNDPRCWRDATPASFQEGYDPRRGKRPKSHPEQLRELAPRAYEELESIITDEKTSKKDKLTAIRYVFEWAFGKPQTAEVMALREITPDSIKKLSLDDALGMLTQIKQGQEK